jgi:uncharacterized membrane protein YfcA
MADLAAEYLAVVALIFFLVGIVKGVTGMGLPTVSMGLLGAFMPAVTAASLLIVPSFITNVWQLFSGPSFGRLIKRLWPMIVGAATGLVTGATGVFVIPAVPYLQALGLAKDDLVQALGLSFTVSTVALAIGLAKGGALHAGSLGLSLLAVLPALLGVWAGQRLRHRISPASFRRWFLICLLLLGLELALRSVW